MISARVLAFTNQDPSKTATGKPLSIVQVSRDPELSHLRAKVLTSAGHSVVCIAPEQSLIECKLSGPSRLWVFCNTVEFYELALIAVAIRQLRPADKLLRMTGLEDHRHAPGLFDKQLEPIEGVNGLLRVVAELSIP